MKYTESHEWVEEEGNAIVRIGITAYAQRELGDIVYVELPAIGKQVNAKGEVAVLESTKAAADIYSPLSGTIVEVNHNLNSAPELINQAPENEGWIYKLALSKQPELDQLMDETRYLSMIS